MSDVRHDVAREFHAALTAGDWERMRGVFAPEITWTLPGDNAVSGRAVGVDAVLERARLIASFGLTFTLEHVLVSRDNVALALHNTARRGDAVLDEYLATVCRLEDARIVEIETFLSNEPGMNAFFVRGDR